MPWPPLFPAKNLNTSSNSIETYSNEDEENTNHNWRELVLIEHHHVCYRYHFFYK